MDLHSSNLRFPRWGPRLCDERHVILPELLVCRTQELNNVSFFFFFYFLLFIFNWRIITVLWWFCHTSTWISHRYTCVLPSWTPLLPCSPPHPSRLSQSPGFGFPASHIKFPLAVSHMVMYMFQCCSFSPHSLFPPLCPKACSSCLCLLCCSAHRIVGPISLDSVHRH